MKKVAILQSNYIPWKGYFDIINLVDEFVIFDTVQYTKRDWRNRNKIKSPNGTFWLSIPIVSNGQGSQKINEVLTAGQNWREKHWRSIKTSYSKAKYFSEYSQAFENAYINSTQNFLSQINFEFIALINKILGVSTKITWSSEYILTEGKNEKLISICNSVGATHYLSGPAGKNYLDVEVFQKRGIKVVWMDYSGYPEYYQLYPPFEHGVSILDLIFNQGPDAPKFMKSFFNPTLEFNK